MNQFNYGSLEACQRLAKAGIVLETDFYHTENEDGSNYAIRPKEDREKYVYCPAPSMAEVWRELPKEIMVIGITGKCTTYWIEKDQKPLTDTFQSNNPTDALIDLLIWVREIR